MTKIALGTWAWGAGAFGGDKVLRGELEARIRCGYESWTESLGHRHGIRYGRVGEDSWFAGAGLQPCGCADFHEVHAADCGDLRQLGGKDGLGIHQSHGLRLHRHLLDSQSYGRGALDTGTDSPAPVGQGEARTTTSRRFVGLTRY